jgi:Arylsulfotransferase (ASST)
MPTQSQPATVRLTRRRLIAAAGAMMVGGAAFDVPALVGSATAPPTLPPVPAPRHGAHTYRSRPDLRPAAVSVSRPAARHDFAMLGPSAVQGAQPGPLIINRLGEPTWLQPLPDDQWATNFRVQEYRGKPVLTWWEGIVDSDGYGHGVGVIADSSYREIARVIGGGGRPIDLHEFQLTARGTVLATCTPDVVRADLTSRGGPKDGQVLEPIFQEIDISSGRPLLEWRSLAHIPVSESRRPLGTVYDYLHINSVAVAADGNLLVSARNTWAIYKLHRDTGAIIWRLGGVRSDFTLGSGVHFSWQHDAREHADGRLTLFDDGSDGAIQTESESRGLLLHADERRRTVSLVQAYPHPQPLLASAMGNVQRQADGRTIIGWGAEPYLSEFDDAGKLVSDMRLSSQQKSYRAYRSAWRGTPTDVPRVAVAVTPERRKLLYVSWNGATEVAHWQVRTGTSARALRAVHRVRRGGFETRIRLDRSSGFVAVAALDRAGRTLGISAPVRY